MACYSAIPYAANTLKSITICYRFHTEFSSVYYIYKGYASRYLFGKYVKTYMKKIYHPKLVQEWKLNLDTAAYLNKPDKK